MYSTHEITRHSPINITRQYWSCPPPLIILDLLIMLDQSKNGGDSSFLTGLSISLDWSFQWESPWPTGGAGGGGGWATHGLTPPPHPPVGNSCENITFSCTGSTYIVCNKRPVHSLHHSVTKSKCFACHIPYFTSVHLKQRIFVPIEPPNYPCYVTFPYISQVGKLLTPCWHLRPITSHSKEQHEIQQAFLHVRSYTTTVLVAFTFCRTEFLGNVTDEISSKNVLYWSRNMWWLYRLTVVVHAFSKGQWIRGSVELRLYYGTNSNRQERELLIQTLITLLQYHGAICGSFM